MFLPKFPVSGILIVVLYVRNKSFRTPNLFLVMYKNRKKRDVI